MFGLTAVPHFDPQPPNTIFVLTSTSSNNYLYINLNFPPISLALSKCLGINTVNYCTTFSLVHSNNIWYSSPSLFSLHRVQNLLCLSIFGFLNLPVTLGRRVLLVLNLHMAIHWFLFKLIKYFSILKFGLTYLLSSILYFLHNHQK